MIETDDVDEGIMALLRDDGRLGYREIARRLDVTEATVRQRIKKLEDAGAIRFGVVTNAERLGTPIVAWVRIAVAPADEDSALDAFARMDETRYVAAVAGRFNGMIVLGAASEVELMRTINTQIEVRRGVSRVDVRIVAQTVKHDLYEVVVPTRLTSS